MLAVYHNCFWIEATRMGGYIIDKITYFCIFYSKISETQAYGPSLRTIFCGDSELYQKLSANVLVKNRKVKIQAIEKTNEMPQLNQIISKLYLQIKPETPILAL